MNYEQHMRRIAKAKDAEILASRQLAKANADLISWGRERFIKALARRKIIVRETLVSVTDGGKTVAARIDYLHTSPKTMERGRVGFYSTAMHWSFSLYLNRLNKDGSFRWKVIRQQAYGDTPEEAAAMVDVWGP